MARSADISFSSPEFIERLQARDPDTVTAVVIRYTRHVYRAALGMGFSAASADEVTQNVWGTFFEILPGFQGKSHVRTFLFGILYNKAKEFHRDRGRTGAQSIDEVFEQRFDADSGSWSQPPMNPEGFLQAVETAGHIQGCLDELPVAQRMAFVLKEVDGATTEEICKILEVSTTNLGVLLHRARNHLRECIEKKAAPQEGYENLS